MTRAQILSLEFRGRGEKMKASKAQEKDRKKQLQATLDALTGAAAAITGSGRAGGPQAGGAGGLGAGVGVFIPVGVFVSG